MALRQINWQYYTLCNKHDSISQNIFPCKEKHSRFYDFRSIAVLLLDLGMCLLGRDSLSKVVCKYLSCCLLPFLISTSSSLLLSYSPWVSFVRQCSGLTTFLPTPVSKSKIYSVHDYSHRFPLPTKLRIISPSLLYCFLFWMNIDFSMFTAPEY